MILTKILYLFELDTKNDEDRINKNIKNSHGYNPNLDETKTKKNVKPSEIIDNNDTDAEKKTKVKDDHAMKVEDKVTTSPLPSPAKRSEASRTVSTCSGSRPTS